MSVSINYSALPAAIRGMIQPAPTNFDRVSEANLLLEFSLTVLKQIAKALGFNGAQRKINIVDGILDANFVRLPSGATPRVQQPSFSASTDSAAGSGASATPAAPFVNGAPAVPAGPSVNSVPAAPTGPSVNGAPAVPAGSDRAPVLHSLRSPIFPEGGIAMEDTDVDAVDYPITVVGPNNTFFQSNGLRSRS